jgi:hypothetical protein
MRGIASMLSVPFIIPWLSEFCNRLGKESFEKLAFGCRTGTIFVGSSGRA